MSTQPNEIIGFDLGHGETAFAKVNLRGKSGAPEILEINSEKNMITAIGWHPRRGVLIGRSALVDPEVSDCRICFKGDPRGKPGESPEVVAERKRVTKEFARACYTQLVEQGKISGDGEAIFYVGCPSGWSRESRASYEALLREAGIPNVKVQAESRGAFLHAKESDKISIDELKNNVLIIDIGSSTTDFTLVQQLVDGPLDFAAERDLGASLIEKAIFRRALATSAQGDELAKLLDQTEQRALRTRLELNCREAKETYFSDEGLYETQQISDVKKVHGRYFFDITLDKQIMDGILSESQPTLGGNSWLEYFRGSLSAIKKQLDKDSIALTAILLTGGASRMRFTQEMCRVIFPSVKLCTDSEPEFCIARGLAHIGRYDIGVVDFMAEIDRLCDPSRLTQEMKNALPQLISLLAQKLGADLVDNVIEPSIEDWKNGEIATLQDLEGVRDTSGKVIREGEMDRRATEWLNGETARKMFAGVIVEWIKPIQDRIEPEVNLLCDRYNIPRGALRLDITPYFDAFNRGDTHGLDIANLDFITDLIAVVFGIIVVKIIALIGIMHLVSGPIGWIVGIAAMIAAAVYGKDRAQEMAKTANLPVFMRKTAFAFKNVHQHCHGMKPQVTQAIQAGLTARADSFDGLFSMLQGKIHEELRARAKDVLELIK